MFKANPDMLVQKCAPILHSFLVWDMKRNSRQCLSSNAIALLQDKETETQQNAFGSTRPSQQLAPHRQLLATGVLNQAQHQRTEAAATEVPACKHQSGLSIVLTWSLSALSQYVKDTT